MASRCFSNGLHKSSASNNSRHANLILNVAGLQFSVLDFKAFSFLSVHRLAYHFVFLLKESIQAVCFEVEKILFNNYPFHKVHFNFALLHIYPSLLLHIILSFV